MFLTIRMVLYFAFASLSGTGIGIFFDPATGMVSFSIDALANVIAGGLGFIGTFWVSRVAKRRGGAT